MAEKKPTKLTRVEPKVYMPMEDPLLPQLYAAIIASRGPSSPLSYREMVDEAVSALAAFRRAETYPDD